MAKRFSINFDDRLAAMIEEKADAKFKTATDFIRDVVADHVLGNVVAATAAVAAEPQERRGPGRPPGAKGKTTEAQVRAMSTAELQAFLEENGYICQGGVEQDWMPDGKINFGTFTKTFIRWNPAKSENEYCVGYFYGGKFLDEDGRRLEPENVRVTQTIGQLIGDLKRKNVI